MAPTRPDLKFAEVAIANKESDRVAKRPKRGKRGYHTFKNGMLNVKPKGSEINVVKSNQQSPLLRLPPEIRNSIWEYALGGNVFRGGLRVKNTYLLRATPSVPKHCFALLRTCRQIYIETASIPYTLSIFSLLSLRWAKVIFKKFKKFMRDQIRTLELITIHAQKMVYDRKPFDEKDLLFLSLIPGFRHIKVASYGGGNLRDRDRESEERLSQQLKDLNKGAIVNLERS